MEYLYIVMISLGIYVILASSFNFVIGEAGLISIAHPAFFATGAYVSAIAALRYGVPIPLAMLLAVVVTFLVSVIISLPALRVSGDYLMIASIGFQLGLIELLKNLAITGGAGGLSGIPSFLVPQIGNGGYAAVVWACAIAVVLVLRYITRSDYGRAMSAMRDDELAFASLGRNPMWVKLWVIGLASAIAGFAGALYAHFFRFMEPDQFDVLQSAALLTMVVVGGMRTSLGPVVGAVLLQILPQAITFLNLPPSVLGPLQGILFTGLVLGFMFFRPRGIVRMDPVWKGALQDAPASGGTHVRGA